MGLPAMASISRGNTEFKIAKLVVDQNSGFFHWLTSKKHNIQAREFLPCYKAASHSEKKSWTEQYLSFLSSCMAFRAIFN